MSQRWGINKFPRIMSLVFLFSFEFPKFNKIHPLQKKDIISQFTKNSRNIIIFWYGPLAQLAEQGTLNAKVGGSTPPRPIKAVLPGFSIEKL